MRILHIGKYYPPHRGGIESAMATLCLELAARGHDVTALVSNDRLARAQGEIDAVRVMRLPRIAELFSQPITLGLRANVAATTPTVVHLHTPNPWAAINVASALPAHTPLVVSHHAEIVRQRTLRTLGEWAQRRLYRRADVILVATPRHLEFSTFLGEFRDKCRILHHPVPRVARDNAPPQATPNGVSPEPALVLFVGRLVPYKGLHVLLEAFTRVPSATLVIAGDGPLRAEFERSAAANPLLRDRVVFKGDVDDSAREGLYRRAQVLVLPSITTSEAFGIVQLEAMAHGVPVVSTDLRSGVPYVNLHERTGLVVPPNDPTALTGAITRLCENPTLRAQLGNAGKTRVRDAFTSSAIVTQLEQLYDELVSKKRQAA